MEECSLLLLLLPQMYYRAQGPSQNWLLASGVEGIERREEAAQGGQAELSKGSGCSSHQRGGGFAK